MKMVESFRSRSGSNSERTAGSADPQQILARSPRPFSRCVSDERSSAFTTAGLDRPLLRGRRHPGVPGSGSRSRSLAHLHGDLLPSARRPTRVRRDPQSRCPYVDLGGFRLEGEIDFTFDRGTRLEPRGCLVVAGDIEAFRERYPEVENVVGPFRRRLANQGGSVRLQNPTGGLAAELRYGRDGRWSAVPDGTDYTLVLADSLFDARVPESWVPSAAPGGTPGSYSARDGERAALRLNEAAVRGATEARSLAWIEIYNASDEPVRLERLFLSDDPAALRKWECPGGNEIPPRGFAVFSEPDLGADAFTGDVLFLTDTRGDRIVDALSLRALPAGLGQDSAEVASIGRYPDGSGSSYILARATRESRTGSRFRAISC